MSVFLVLGMFVAGPAPAPAVTVAEIERSEIIVTARQSRTEPDRLVGAIETLDTNVLARPGLYSASDLERVTAGLTYKSIFGSSAPQFFIRGIGGNDVNPSANPGVAVYLNDVLIASPLGQNLALFDVREAAVLKGPQGTLFGRNATGGAVVFKTAQPGEDPAADLTAGLGSFGVQSVVAAVDSGRVGPMRARLAAFSRRSDGYTDDVLSGETLNGIETAGVRATLTFDGAGPWRADVMADFGQDRSGMTAHEGLGLFAPESLGGDPSSVTRCSNDRAARNECVNLLGYRYSSDPYSEAFDRSGREYLDVGGVSVSVARSGVIDVHAITSYRTAAREVLEDTDASPLSIVALDFDNESEVFTQELLFQGQYGRLDWSTGVFFLNESLSTENRFDTLGTLRGVGVGFIDDPALFAFGPFRLEQVYSQDTRSHAVFGEIDWAATSALTLTAGLRLTTERTKFATETRFDEVTAMPVLSPLRQASQTDDAASWRLAGRYAFTPERSIYASVSRGFKSGGFNGGALFPSDSIGPVAPEFVTAYEAGAQWRLSDRVGLEASVFRYDYTDLQDFTLQAAPPPTRQVLDSADAEMLGADVRVETRLPSGFTAAAGASLLDATFVDFVDANGVDRSGNRLTAAPEVSALLSLDWQAQLTPIWFARANLNLKHRSEIFFDNSNDALLKSKDATLTDMTFNLEHRPAQVTVSVSVRNLTNEAVVVDALNIAEYGFIQQTYAPPRTVFVELRKRL